MSILSRGQAREHGCGLLRVGAYVLHSGDVAARGVEDVFPPAAKPVAEEVREDSPEPAPDHCREETEEQSVDKPLERVC